MWWDEAWWLGSELVHISMPERPASRAALNLLSRLWCAKHRPRDMLAMAGL